VTVATAQIRVPAAARREQILEVSTRLFAQQGYSGTTTRQLALAAGVNEALLFRHFPSKEELYWAVIEAKIASSAPVEQMRRRLAGGGTELEIFGEIACDILERRSRDSSLSRLLLFTALENHRLSKRFFQRYAAGYYEVLAEYVRRRMDEGTFRRTNPLLAARAFVGMVVYHSWVQEIFGGKRYQEFDVREASRTLAELWLQGLRAEVSGPK
jgi:AcrR family transcriptional regulator